MRVPILIVAGLAIAACDDFAVPGLGGGPPAVDPAREAQFVALVEGAGCELDQQDNDALLDPAGFGDAEASAIAQGLITDGRAEITPDGNLQLLTGNCV